MGKVKIITDSTCDLTDDLLNERGIIKIPLCILLDEKSYFDGEDIDPQSIFQWSDQWKKTPKTSAPSFEKVQEKLLLLDEIGNEIIFIGISEEMSTTCNVLRLAGEELKYAKLYVIDSMNLSTGIGLQVLRAADYAQKGKSAEEIVELIRQNRTNVRASFVIDTLTYLARGGRCSQVTALLANTLQLKPRIEVHDGKMGVAKKYRGNINFVLKKYAQELIEDLRKADPERIFITHSSCESVIVDEIYNMIEKLDHFREIHITDAGSVISSHCGPKTLGILFYER